MGVHLSVHNADGDRHPNWNWLRCAGDKEVAGTLTSLPHVSGPPGEAWIEDAIRPSDFTAWRVALAYTDDETFPNAGRFSQLIDLLEGDAQWWLTISW